MPTRYLKESICTSDDINNLTAFEETVFYRLIVTVDDYGRFDGRIPVLKSRLFPLKEDMRATQVEKAIESLSSAGMVKIYYVDKKPFLQMTGWDRHQTARASKSKYPGPELSDTPDQENTVSDACIQPYTDADNRIQIPTDSLVIDIRNSKSKSLRACAREELHDDDFVPDYEALDEYRESMAGIEKAAKALGFPCSPEDTQTIEALMADYTAEWLLQAIQRTRDRAEKSRNWGYVKAILTRWKRDGGPDSPESSPARDQQPSAPRYSVPHAF